jgi:predicted dehydrogenase
MWLLGGIESVAGHIAAAVHRYPGCDELGEALLEFANGALGTLAAGWVDVDDPVRLLVSGTEGHAVIVRDQLFVKSVALSSDGKEPWTDLPEAWPHAFELFLDAIAGQPTAPLVTAREAAERSRVMQAIYRASEERRWVQVATV